MHSGAHAFLIALSISQIFLAFVFNSILQLNVDCIITSIPEKSDDVKIVAVQML